MPNLYNLLLTYILVIFTVSICVGFIISETDLNSNKFTLKTRPKEGNNTMKFIYKLMYGIYIGFVSCFAFSPLIILTLVLFAISSK